MNLAGLEAEFFSEGRDRFLVGQMPANELGFFFRGEATTAGTQGLNLRSGNYQADREQIPFSTGAEHGSHVGLPKLLILLSKPM